MGHSKGGGGVVTDTRLQHTKKIPLQESSYNNWMLAIEEKSNNEQL